MPDERKFPILKGTDYHARTEAIPWSVIEIVADDANREHGQTLDTLARRGGLSWSEVGHLFVRHFAIEQGHAVRSAYADFQVARSQKGTG